MPASAAAVPVGVSPGGVPSGLGRVFEAARRCGMSQFRVRDGAVLAAVCSSSVDHCTIGLVPLLRH